MSAGTVLGWGAALALLGGWAYSKRASSYAHLHPELRSPLLRFRSPPFTATLVQILRRLRTRFPLPTDVRAEVHQVPSPPGAPDVPVYVYRPHEGQEPAAALLYIHGGGFIVGSAAAYHATAARYARELGIVVVNVDYRLAPDTPFPGPLEDCYAALLWMKRQADDLGIDPARIAIAGDSAGGGLAAALAQLAHDRGEVEPLFQLLLYPMLDDRTVLERDHEGRGEFVWRPRSNRLGWSSYLGRAPVPEVAPEYAAPARRDDLSGLAPAWIGVGTLDLFHPEGEAYARRLREAGVPCEFYEAEGTYHASEVMQPDAATSKTFRERSVAALRQGLRPTRGAGARS